MGKQNAISLMSLFIVVAVSGCILPQGGSTGTGKGVVFTAFAPDISEVYSGDSVTLSASVENIGKENAYDVGIKIFGLGTDWSGTDWDTNSERTKDVGFLERSQSDEGISGGIGDLQWDVTTPDNLKVDNTYSVNARLYYTYTTTGLANLKIYHSEYLASDPSEAQQIMRTSAIESFTVTDAPITIELAGLARPLIYRDSGQQASMTLLISNIGNGKPYLTEEDAPEITIIKMQVNGEECEEDITDEDYRLPRTGRKSVSCKFDIPYTDSYTTMPVEIELGYRYYTDTTSSITVLKSLFAGDEDRPNIEDQAEDGDPSGKPLISKISGETYISNYLTEIGTDYAKIRFDTDIKSKCTLYYTKAENPCGTTPAKLEDMTKKPDSSYRSTSRTKTLSSLSSDTQYKYLIICVSKDGETRRVPSGCYTFTTESSEDIVVEAG